MNRSCVILMNDWKENLREKVKLKVFSFLHSSSASSLNDILPEGVIRTMFLLIIVLSHKARLPLISVFMILLSSSREKVEKPGKIS